MRLAPPSIHRTLPALLCIACLLGMSSASAQFGGGGLGNKQRSGSSDRNRSDAQKNNQDSRNERPAEASYEQIEYRLVLLEESLKLESQQQSNWQNFAEKARAYAADMARERAQNAVPPASVLQPTALQHVGHRVDAMRNHLTALEDVEAATKALFQSLSPTQKAIADMRIPTIIAPRPIVPMQRP